MKKKKAEVHKSSLFLFVVLTIILLTSLVVIGVSKNLILYQYLCLLLVIYYILKVIYARMFGVLDD